jgi:hypothetical protein
MLGECDTDGDGGLNYDGNFLFKLQNKVNIYELFKEFQTIMEMKDY